MKLFKFFLFTLVVSCILSSCAPSSKYSYMDKFGEFITEVANNHKSYSNKDWDRQTNRYNKFVGKWYEKFRDKFTARDQLTIASYQAKWFIYVNKVDGDDVKSIKEKARFYIENDMQEDLRNLYNGAVQAGSEVQESVEEVLKEMDVDVDSLKKE